MFIISGKRRLFITSLLPLCMASEMWRTSESYCHTQSHTHTHIRTYTHTHTHTHTYTHTHAHTQHTHTYIHTHNTHSVLCLFAPLTLHIAPPIRCEEWLKVNLVKNHNVDLLRQLSYVQVHCIITIIMMSTRFSLRDLATCISWQDKLNLSYM